MIANPIIKINGEEVHNPMKGLYSVTDYSVHATFMNAAGTFEINFTDLDRDRVFPNSRVQIILDDTSIMKGIIDETVEEISNSSVSLRCSGRDYAGWWLSNDCEPKTYNNMLDNAIILDMINQGLDQLSWGILPFEYDLGTPYTIKQYVASAGRSLYDCWAEIANVNNLYMHFDAEGKLHKMKLANEGTPVAFFDLEDKFEGSATITRSIADAKSDIWIQGRVSTVSGGARGKKDSLTALLNGPSSAPGSLSDIISGKAVARKKAGSFYAKHIRPDNLHIGKFRTEGRTFDAGMGKPGDIFRRRIVTTQPKRIKAEIDKENQLQFDKTAPIFDVKLTMSKLYNITVNQIVRVRYKDMDTNMVVHTVDYTDSPTQQQTVLSLKLPGRIR